MSWDQLKVFHASDKPEDGSCGINPGTAISTGQVGLAAHLGAVRAFAVACKEHDKNGGDRIVRGQVLCL
jgi:hypothetical protein